ncbi:MAG: T9SS type A sorting domain-containing protein [Saprospiraceae bacterium]|nr:T9SS type A sorting domain-containing protein [Saprospiraceae bacterium]
MKAHLTAIFLLIASWSISQPFEYVLTEVAGSTFNKAGVINDRIMIATNVGFCPGAGLSMFDTLGSRLFLENYNDYYSIAPSICAAGDGTMYLLTFKNESEEFYDDNQMIIYHLNQDGAVLNTRIDTAGFDYDGQILIDNDRVVVLCGSYIYRYTHDLTLVDTFKITPETSSSYDFDLIKVDSAHWTLIRKHTEYLEDSRIMVADQIIIIDDNQFSSGQLFNLTFIQGIAAYTNSHLYVLGADQYLRKVSLSSGHVLDSILLPDLLDFKIVEMNDEIFMGAISRDSILGIYNVDFSGQQRDTIWTMRTKETISEILVKNDNIFLITDLNLSDGSYRKMNYPVIRKVPLHSPFQISREDISIENVEVLQSFEHEESSLYPEGNFNSAIPAIVGITVKNNSSVTIHNFGYFSESTGGSFCFPGRTTKFVQGEIMPQQTFYFEDTIYPLPYEARDFNLSFYVAAANHQIDPEHSNNRFEAKLFTTAIKRDRFSQIRIYPNPTSGILFYDGLENEGDLRIFDLQGKIFFQSDAGNKEIDLTGLARGAYIFQYLSSQGQVQKLFIKE